jgi:hypothetical protein
LMPFQRPLRPATRLANPTRSIPAPWVSFRRSFAFSTLWSARSPRVFFESMPDPAQKVPFYVFQKALVKGQAIRSAQCAEKPAGRFFSA